MSAHGKYLTAQATTAATANSTADAVIQVPTGKSYLFDFMRVSVDATNNEVTFYIEHNQVYDQFWEKLSNVTTAQDIDLQSKFPRALQVDSGEQIIARVKTLEAVAKTITFEIWVIEG